MKDIEILSIKDLEKEKIKYEEEFLNKVKSFKKVMLWGMSECAVEAIQFFSKNGIKVDGIYDNNVFKNGKSYLNINIMIPDHSIYDKDTALIVTCSYYETIRESLLKNDSNIDNRLFMYDGYFLEDKSINYYDDNKEKILNCYRTLEDEKSKLLYINLLKYRYIRDINLIKDLYDSRLNCYLDTIFLNNYKKGLYVDAGSYNADFITTLNDRIDLTDSKFYIFEPNKIFSQNIRENLKDRYDYKVFEVALCDKKGKMEFQQIDSSTSHLVDKKYNAYKNTLDKNVELVETNTIDNILDNIKVTGIKIDIEGSEQAMLKGSINTIKRDRPILLISVYHKWNDLWEIQDELVKLNLNYKFYLRHYSLSVAKTILYCIPC